jgi:hypothetical protein
MKSKIVLTCLALGTLVASPAFAQDARHPGTASEPYASVGSAATDNSWSADPNIRFELSRDKASTRN